MPLAFLSPASLVPEKQQQQHQHRHQHSHVRFSPLIILLRLVSPEAIPALLPRLGSALNELPRPDARLATAQTCGWITIVATI